MSHNILDVAGVVAFLEEAERIDRALQVRPGEVAAALGRDDPRPLLDVRTREEWELARIDGATRMTEVMLRWPRDTPIVFSCHHGQRRATTSSSFAGHGFAGHGFTNVGSMTGGLEAWSLAVDPAVPRDEVAGAALDGGVVSRPLRSAVSAATGWRSSELRP